MISEHESLLRQRQVNQIHIYGSKAIKMEEYASTWGNKFDIDVKQYLEKGRESLNNFVYYFDIRAYNPAYGEGITTYT